MPTVGEALEHVASVQDERALFRLRVQVILGMSIFQLQTPMLVLEQQRESSVIITGISSVRELWMPWVA